MTTARKPARPTTTPMIILLVSDSLAEPAVVAGAIVGGEIGDCVIAVTTAAVTVGAGVFTPEKTFASIDPAALVTFKNCNVNIAEKALVPPLTDVTDFVSVVFTDAVSNVDLFAASVEVKV